MGGTISTKRLLGSFSRARNSLRNQGEDALPLTPRIRRLHDSSRFLRIVGRAA